MPFYWSSKSVPELASLPKARRKEIFTQCVRATRMPLWIWISYFLAWPLGQIFLQFFIFRRFRTPLWGALPLFVWYLSLVVLLSHLRVTRALPEIRRRVGGMCPECGYDLRSTPERCPECGAIPHAAVVTPK
jgi:hypothetical protein